MRATPSAANRAASSTGPVVKASSTRPTYICPVNWASVSGAIKARPSDRSWAASSLRPRRAKNVPTTAIVPIRFTPTASPESTSSLSVSASAHRPSSIAAAIALPAMKRPYPLDAPTERAQATPSMATV